MRDTDALVAPLIYLPASIAACQRDSGMSGGFEDLGLLPELVRATQELGWLCVLIGIGIGRGVASALHGVCVCVTVAADPSSTPTTTQLQAALRRAR